MGASSALKNNKKVELVKSDSKKDQTAEVLYQKIGNRWYAYSVVDEEVFMGAIPEEALNEIVTPTKK